MTTSRQTSIIDYAIITRDLQDVILSWSHGAERIFGFSSAEMVGSSFMRLIPPEHQEDENQIIDKVTRGRTVARFETVYLNKDGRWLYVLATSTPIKDEAGNITGVSTVTQDVTEKKTAEKSLLESSHFAQAAIDAFPAHICVLAESGRIIGANLAWRKYPELSSLAGTDTQLGANYLKVCDEAEGDGKEQARAFAAGIRAVFSGEKKAFEMEYPCHTADQERWFLGRVTPFPGVEVLRVVVAHEDITARKQADEENHKLRQLVEHSPDFIGLADMDGRITFLNAGGRKMIGLDEHQDLGAFNFKDYVPPQWQDFFRKTVLATAIKKGVWNGEMQLFNLKTGALIEVSRTTFVITDESSDKKFIASVTRDITERKRAENELRWKTTILEAQVNSSRDAVLVVNEQGTRILQNQRLTEMFNLPAKTAETLEVSQVRDQVALQMKHPRQFLERIEWLYAHPNEVGLDEIEMLEGRILERYTSPIRDEAGKYYGRIWSLRDITERKKAAADTQNQLNELQRWHEAMLDREDRVIALKQEVNELLTRLKLPARYDSAGNS